MMHCKRESLEKRIFIISPVRDRSEEDPDIKEIREYVANLREFHIVHWPYDTTDQKDPIGYNICMENAFGIEGKTNSFGIQKANEVHIWFDPESQGSVFDLGMAFVLNKPIYVINYARLEPTPDKSFTNVLMEKHAEYMVRVGVMLQEYKDMCCH